MFFRSRTALFLITTFLCHSTAFSEDAAPPPLPPLAIGDPLSGFGGEGPAIEPLPPTPIQISEPAPAGELPPLPAANDAPPEIPTGDVAPIAAPEVPTDEPSAIATPASPAPDLPGLPPLETATPAPAKPQDAGSVIDSFFSDSKIIAPAPAPAPEPEKTEEATVMPPLPMEEQEAPKKVVRKAPPKPAYNFKSQILPPSIYKKQYSSQNRHLPKAVSKEDLSAKMAIVIARGDLSDAKALRDFGVPITALLPSGDTPLILATRYQQPRIMQWLLSQGAPVNDTDTNGFSALHYAAFAGSSEMVDMLLSYGADPNITDTRGLTPLSYANIRGAQGIQSVIRSFGGV